MESNFQKSLSSHYDKNYLLSTMKEQSDVNDIYYILECIDEKLNKKLNKNQKLGLIRLLTKLYKNQNIAHKDQKSTMSIDTIINGYDIQEKLLNLFENEEDDTVISELWELLEILPTPPSLLKLSRKIDDFIDIIFYENNVKDNPYKTIYCQY